LVYNSPYQTEVQSRVQRKQARKIVLIHTRLSQSGWSYGGIPAHSNFETNCMRKYNRRGSSTGENFDPNFEFGGLWGIIIQRRSTVMLSF
jgi:hypothetical protein